MVTSDNEQTTSTTEAEQAPSAEPTATAPASAEEASGEATPPESSDAESEPEPPEQPKQPDLEQLLAQARAEERERLLAEQAEARDREAAEQAEAERKASEQEAEEKRRAELSEAERAKLEAEDARREAAKEKAAKEAAEAKAAETSARNDMLRGLVDGGLQLQADPAVEDLALERVSAKVSAGKTVAEALTELRAENAWLFKSSSEPARPPTNLGGNPGGRAETAPAAPRTPKKFDALKASPAEVKQRMRELAAEQKKARRVH